MKKISYVCKSEVMKNVWHHNVIVDGIKMRVIENSDFPMTEKEVIDGINFEILVTTEKWVAKCD